MPAAAAAAAPAGKGWKNIRNGAVLQCTEAITLGMPLEVWKTRMGRMRSETTMEAFWNIHKQGGGGLMGFSAFWKGTAPKMVESASKGAVLIYAKEAISESCGAVGIGAADIAIVVSRYARWCNPMCTCGARLFMPVVRIPCVQVLCQQGSSPAQAAASLRRS